MKINSPLQEITYKGNRLWIKRDDLIDPFISGNKWRKLKYILKDAKAKNKKHLVTFGGAYSNHLVATASAASREALRSTGFVRGEAVENDVLRLCQQFGMHLVFVSRETYKNKQDLFNRYFGSDKDACFIDEGGAGIEGMKGCAELINEIPDSFDHIFCAAGTGTTSAGLLAGITASKFKAKLEVIPVLKNGQFIKDQIVSLTDHFDNATLHCDFHFGGYAKTKPELVHFIKDFVSATGVPLDPVYTGKMCFAIFSLLEQGYFKNNAKILAVHTGGLLGILGMKDKFG